MGSVRGPDAVGEHGDGERLGVVREHVVASVEQRSALRAAHERERRARAGTDADGRVLAGGPHDGHGVVEHGLFPSAMVSDVVVGRGEQVEMRRLR